MGRYVGRDGEGSGNNQGVVCLLVKKMFCGIRSSLNFEKRMLKTSKIINNVFS